MKIAIDISPINNKEFSGHKVRGVGVYVENLKENIEKYDTKNNYLFFNRGDFLPNDLDVIHYPYFEPFFLTLPFNNLKKTVVTVHDLTPIVFSKNFTVGIKGSLKWLFQKKILQRVGAIIADSDASKNDIIKFANIAQSKIHVVYLAASKEFKKIREQDLEIEELRNKYGLPEKFILYVGDVTWNKNLPRLVDAIKKIDVPLVMVGKTLAEKNINNNPWNKDLITIQNAVEHNKNIIRLGFIPVEDLVYLYNMALVFVMPSLYEGFGLPILEAMSCGCPVVTTREGSIPEVAGNAVFYVDPYDTSSIANGLTKVILDKSLQTKLSENGLQEASLFAWKKTIAQTINVYEAISKK